MTKHAAEYSGDIYVPWSIQLDPLRGNAHFPLHVLWPGFAINTVFYAAVLWVAYFIPGFVRRRIRARRGQCPACAYPIGTSTVCTECGGPVAERKVPVSIKR